MDRAVTNTAASSSDNHIVPQLWSHHHALNFGPNFPVSNMIALDTIGDGNCLIHAIVQAYYRPYVIGEINRRQFVRDLRRALAQKLNQPAEVNGKSMVDGAGKKQTWYQIINRGGLARLQQDPGVVPVDIEQRYQLTTMQNELNSNTPLDDMYDDYLSKMLNKNIFVLDLRTKSIKHVIDRDMLWSPYRPCVVILDKGGHYETVGLNEKGIISTYFSWEHPFIVQLRLLTPG